MTSQYMTRTGSKPFSKMFVLRRPQKRAVDRLLIARTNGPASSDHKYSRRSAMAISGELAGEPGTTTCSHELPRGKAFRKDKSSRATQQFGTLSLQLSAFCCWTAIGIVAPTWDIPRPPAGQLAKKGRCRMKDIQLSAAVHQYRSFSDHQPAARIDPTFYPSIPPWMCQRPQSAACPSQSLRRRRRDERALPWQKACGQCGQRWRLRPPMPLRT